MEKKITQADRITALKQYGEALSPSGLCNELGWSFHRAQEAFRMCNEDSFDYWQQEFNILSEEVKKRMESACKSPHL